jgi:glutamate:GABA antiporter
MTAISRTLSRWDVVWFFVTAVASLRWIATAAAAGPSSLSMWAAALLLFYAPLAFTVISLSARFPGEGGLYIWTKHAFGDFAGFITGWMYWMSTVLYFPGLLYFAAGNALFIVDPTGQRGATSPAYFIVASLLALALALALNLRGMRFGKQLQNAGGFGNWISIALLLVIGAVCVVRFGPATPIAAADLLPSPSTASIIFWSTIAFGFGGFEAAAFMGDEVVGGARTIRRAVIVAGAIIAGIYILGTIAVLVALPPGQISGLQGIMQAISGAAARLGWTWLTPIAAALLTLGILGGISSWLGATSRLPFVAGVDRALPPAFARLHPRWGTPHISLIAAAALAALFAFLGQAGASVKSAYDVLVSLVVILYFIPYALMFAALIRLDRRRWARALGALGLAITLLSIGLAAMPAPDAPSPVLSTVKVVGGSVLLLALGALLYRRGRRHQPPANPESGQPSHPPSL